MARPPGGVQREAGNSLQRFSPAAEVAGPSSEYRDNQSYHQEMNFRYATERSNSTSLQSKQHQPQQDETIYLGASPAPLNAEPQFSIGVHRLPVQPAPLRHGALALPQNPRITSDSVKIRQIHIQIATETADRSENRSADNPPAKLLCSLDNKLISLDEAQAIISNMANVAPVINNIFGKSAFPNTDFQCATNVQSTEDNLTNLHSKIMELSKINKVRLLDSLSSADFTKTGQGHQPVPPVSFEPSDTHYTQRLLVNYSPVTPPTEGAATSHLANLLDDSTNVKIMQSNYREKLSRAIEGHNAEQTGPVRMAKTRRPRKSQNKGPDPCEARNISAIPNQYYVTRVDRNLEIRENALQRCERPYNDGQPSNVVSTEYVNIQDSTYGRQRNNPKQTYRYCHPRFNSYVTAMDINTNRTAIQQQQMIPRAMVQECEGPSQQQYGNIPQHNGSWVLRSHPPQVPETWQNNRTPQTYTEMQGIRPNNNMYYANYSQARFMHDPDI